MAVTPIRQASERVLAVFNALPCPKELSAVDSWEMIHSDSGAIFQHTGSGGAFMDEYYSWVSAKLRTIGSVNEPRRFAVGIRWTGDELDGNLEEVVGRKITRAVLGFCDMAEEYEEDGPLPEPIVGVSLLWPKRAVRIAYDKAKCTCGGRMVFIRGKYPNSPKRLVCPTCTMEQLEDLKETTSGPAKSTA